MSDGKKDTDYEGPLMSDKAFAEFMEAKFKKESQSVDEIERLKVWNELSQKMSQPERKQNWLTFASVAILVIAILPTLFVPSEFTPTIPQDSTRIKGGEVQINPELQVFRLSNDGNLMEIDETAGVDDTLVFKVNVQNEAYVALAQSKNKKMANIRFISEPINANIPSVLKRENRTYGYSVDSADQVIKFCLLAASTHEELEKKVNRLAALWPNIANYSCKSISIE